MATAITLGSVLLNVMAGYAFAKLRFKGRDRIFQLLLAALVIPAQVTMLPLFLMLKEIGLQSFPMVTGGKGVHVVVPLKRGHSWDEHREFAEALARVMGRLEEICQRDGGDQLITQILRQFNAVTGEFAKYDETQPLKQIADFFLNFDATEGVAVGGVFTTTGLVTVSVKVAPAGSVIVSATSELLA